MKKIKNTTITLLTLALLVSQSSQAKSGPGTPNTASSCLVNVTTECQKAKTENVGGKCTVTASAAYWTVPVSTNQNGFFALKLQDFDCVFSITKKGCWPINGTLSTTNALSQSLASGDSCIYAADAPTKTTTTGRQQIAQ
jgi:hypothetical protein